MIEIFFYRQNDYIKEFTVKNHSKKNIVCSAISMISINTVNSIEAFTNSKFSYDYDEKNGGYLNFKLIEFNKDANLLLESMNLGCLSVNENYKNEILIYNKEV